jgi:OmpA-OmpF porin, OOP family
MKKLALCLLAAPLLMGSANHHVFKNPDRAYRSGPEPISSTTVAQLMEGMTRRQVRDLVGTPHFAEGIMVKHWNYLFNLTDNGRVVGKSCQLRLDFDEGRVVRLNWERADCAELVS